MKIEDIKPFIEYLRSYGLTVSIDQEIKVHNLLLSIVTTSKTINEYKALVCIASICATNHTEYEKIINLYDLFRSESSKGIFSKLKDLIYKDNIKSKRNSERKIYKIIFTLLVGFILLIFLNSKYIYVNKNVSIGYSMSDLQKTYERTLDEADSRLSSTNNIKSEDSIKSQSVEPSNNITSSKKKEKKPTDEESHEQFYHILIKHVIQITIIFLIYLLIYQLHIRIKLNPSLHSIEKIKLIEMFFDSSPDKLNYLKNNEVNTKYKRINVLKTINLREKLGAFVVIKFKSKLSNSKSFCVFIERKSVNDHQSIKAQQTIEAVLNRYPLDYKFLYFVNSPMNSYDNTNHYKKDFKSHIDTFDDFLVVCDSSNLYSEITGKTRSWVRLLNNTYKIMLFNHVSNNLGVKELTELHLRNYLDGAF